MVLPLHKLNANDIITKYKLDQSTWTAKGFHGILHAMFPVGEEPILPLRKHYGDSATITLVFLQNNYGHWYWNDDDMKRLRESFIAKVNRNPKFLNYWLNLWKSLLGEFIKSCKKCDVDLKQLSDKELLALYKQFYDAYLEEYGVGIGIQDAFSMHADKFFLPLIKEVAAKKRMASEEVFATLTAPITESFVALEYKDRLALLDKVKKYSLNEKVKKLIEKHAAKWFWIENNYAVQKVLDCEYFTEKILTELHLGTDPKVELKKIKKRVPQTKLKKKELIKKLGLSPEIKNLIRITEVFAYMQDERKKYVLISNHYQRRFFEEIGRRIGLNSQEMAYTIYPELEDVLIHKKFDKEILARRKKSCLCIQTLKGYELIEGSLALEIFDTIFNQKAKAEEVKGTCASSGKAQGIAKIVRTVHDLVNVYKGDVLVASMTRPEMVVAMEKAVAIVTDEGGITSHAAIVSRELGVPCIVGTKHATTVFKSGDLVEVDATKGIVKKIK